jgi:hypothetical protein
VSENKRSFLRLSSTYSDLSKTHIRRRRLPKVRHGAIKGSVAKIHEGKTMGVKSHFWLRLDNQSKQAGDKGNLSSGVSFWLCCKEFGRNGLGNQVSLLCSV